MTAYPSRSSPALIPVMVLGGTPLVSVTTSAATLTAIIAAPSGRSPGSSRTGASGKKWTPTTKQTQIGMYGGRAGDPENGRADASKRELNAHDDSVTSILRAVVQR